jgi:hypothetical protein
VNASTIGFRVSKYVVKKEVITFKSYLKARHIASPPLRKKIEKNNYHLQIATIL